MKKEDLTAFNPKSDFTVVERALPHWSQAGTICFVTWRLADSLPKAVLNRLDSEILAVLFNENMTFQNWKAELTKRSAKQRGIIQRKLFKIRERYLDRGLGTCWLARKDCAEQVLESLQYFDEQRYFLTDVVVMPNHVHFLCAFADEAQLLKQCKDWKRYLARNINKLVSRNGPLWQVDQYDHLVRSLDQFDHFRRYVWQNPEKAGLRRGQFLRYSKRL